MAWHPERPGARLGKRLATWDEDARDASLEEGGARIGWKLLDLLVKIERSSSAAVWMAAFA